MIKSVLTYVPPPTQQTQLLDYALSFASIFDAHLEGVAFTFLPELSRVYATMPDDFFSSMQKWSETEADNARQQFDHRAKEVGVSHSVRSFTATAHEAEAIFGRAARCFDIAIVPQTETQSAGFFNPSFEDAMFASGRPTLFVPTIQKQPACLDRILLCWSGDRFAARAAADALPLMERSKAVDILQIESSGDTSPECHATMIAGQLRRHDIRTELHVFGSEDLDVGAAILSFAADCESTLIVMGGYGHARAREFLFGGATREVLGAMTVPVLMSH